MRRISSVFIFSMVVTGCKNSDRRSQSNPEDRAAAQAANHATVNIPKPTASAPVDDAPLETLAISAGAPIEMRVVGYSNATSPDTPGKFIATLTAPIVTPNLTVPAGATATGDVVTHEQVATLELNGVQSEGHSYSLTLADRETAEGDQATRDVTVSKPLPKITVPRLRVGASIAFNASDPHI